MARLGFAGSAQAEFPDKGVTLIVAYGAGGGTDTTARLLAKDLEETLGQSVTVQNITGGGGWNGWGSANMPTRSNAKRSISTPSLT